MQNIEWIDITKKSHKHITYPALAQLKIDGELVAWDGYEGKLWNSYGKHKHWIDTKGFPDNCVLFGELYYNDGKNFYEYQKHMLESSLKVKFHDVVSYKGKQAYGRVPCITRYHMLCDIVKPYPFTYEVRGTRQVNRIYKDMFDKGYEGIVIKPFDSLTCSTWVKLKRCYHDRLLIIGKRKEKEALVVGTADRVLGAVSTMGWQAPLRKVFAKGIMVTREDKENVYFSCGIVVEVRHNGFTGVERECKMRNPVLTRICDEAENLTIS
jgi:ATP-dependent DNA ligase